MMRAMHHLLTTMIFAEGCFTSPASQQALRTFIDHLLRMISEPCLIEKISANLMNSESILIDAALITLCVLVHESDVCDYMRQSQCAPIFRRLISTPCEYIVSSAYMMLAYTIKESDLQESQDVLAQLLGTTLDHLQQAIVAQHRAANTQDKPQQEANDRRIIPLIGTLRGSRLSSLTLTPTFDHLR